MNKLKKYRDKSKTSQYELAVLCGWEDGKAIKKSNSRIANYESGYRIPSLNDSRIIVNALNLSGIFCSLDDVFPPKRIIKNKAA
jgi:putative transcriptional regulator